MTTFQNISQWQLAPPIAPLESRVLLFEPNLLNAWKIGKALLRQNIQVHICSEILDVYAHLARNPQHTIILDADKCDSQLMSVVHFARMKNPTTAILLLTSTESAHLHKISQRERLALYSKNSLTSEMLSKAVVSRMAQQHKIDHCEHGMSVLIQNIQEATTTTFGGEIVVRSINGIGRMYFINHLVAWIYIQDSNKTLLHDLVELEGIEKEELKSVYQECRRTGLNFADMLVNWHMIPWERMRNILSSRFVDCLNRMAAWQNVRSIFIPDQRKYQSDLLFPLSDLLSGMKPSPFSRQLSRLAVAQQDMV
ncbi:MAG: hypothetical protein JXR76_18115 [Deltaproteobacteria bacterium]|nr:hypothetical protein [Deltaproteobacteria bacterium]